MRNSSQEGELRSFNREKAFSTPDRFFESMETLTIEIILRLSQEMDSMMSMMHQHINRAIYSAKAERVLPEIRNMVSSLSSGNRDTDCPSSNNQENNNGSAGFKTKTTKKNCRSAFDLRDTEDLTSYIYYQDRNV